MNLRCLITLEGLVEESMTIKEPTVTQVKNLSANPACIIFPEILLRGITGSKSSLLLFYY